jgi:hypothetical protein
MKIMSSIREIVHKVLQFGVVEKRKLDYIAIVWLLLLTILTRHPIGGGPLWGDDALLYRASRMPSGYASDFWLGFVQTGSAKYRPLLTPVLALMTDTFGNDQFGYLVLTNFL